MELETFPLSLPFVTVSHFTLSATLFVSEELFQGGLRMFWGFFLEVLAMVSIRYMTQLAAEIWEHNPTV